MTEKIKSVVYGVEFFGPLANNSRPRSTERYFLIVDGCQIPHVAVYFDFAKKEWEFAFMRLGQETFIIESFTSQEHVALTAMCIANGMAMACGRTSFGLNSNPVDQFAMRIHSLDGMPELPLRLVRKEEKQ